VLQLVQKRVPVIYGGGTGHAYPIYIDNLIDGMILAATHPAAVGQAFNFCDPPVTFKEWFAYYGQMCGRKPVAMPLFLARLLVFFNDTLGLGLPLTLERLTYFLIRADFPTTKAQTLLGYQPRVPIAEGMRHTEAWLRQAGYLD
jgi:nucleoside-diphosphate-sugar epimerase